MTVAKLKIVLSNITDAYNSINDDFKNHESFERKLTLLNLATSIRLFLKEASTKYEYSQIELDGITVQLSWLANLRNKGTITSEDINLEAQLLKRKEDILLAMNDWEVMTTVNLPEELTTQITSWYD
jgi:hypothetical protein